MTRREAEILRLVAEGHSNADVARMLWIAEQTVKFHLSNVYRKLNVSNRTEASRWAQRARAARQPGRRGPPDSGARRCLTAPRCSSTGARAARPADRARPARRTAVLLDPHPLWLDALERVLGRTGVVVVAKTSTPAEALAAVEEHRPDLFVTEITGAEDGLDGVSWLRRVLERAPAAKAVVLSRLEQPETIDAALRAGAVAYVIKTAHPDDLASAVRQVFDHSVFLGAPGPQPSLDASALAESHGLTARELEILQLLVEGHTNAQLGAHALGDRADGEVPPVEHLPQARRVEPERGEPHGAARRPRRRRGLS